MKKQFLNSHSYLFALLFFFSLSSGCKEKCKICKEEKIILDDYKIIYPNGEGEKQCDYIILKKKAKQVSSTLFDWIDPNNNNSSSAKQKIPVDKAIDFVKMYNEKFNKNLEATSFIDLDRREVMLYLIDVMEVLPENDTSNIFRVYLADRGNATTNKISAIITTVSDKGETHLDNPKLLPLDWGSLCPPPYRSCIGEKKAYILQEAIKRSPELFKTVNSADTTTKK